MPDLKTMFIRQRKYIFLLLSVYVLGWGFTSYQSIFMGLIVGTSLSLFNLWLMVRKTDQLGEAAANGQRMRSLGMLSRMATAVLAVMISMKYPDEVHLISVVLGLMTSYIVIMIDYFLQLFVLRK
ncbi:MULTISPECIES: ATP synthase subunit I [Bacillaceae]|uniref:ATP synthase subunit I n=1 Tax=Bacillus infantis TaxID=324767 RepID=A0A5D4SNV9_9BACI|nr:MULTISPECIES: ATP synthase subunit I [Bacillus]OXT16028.1 ATP synthase subunit [Bacillus sp. OG2]MCK6206692.1 ATP synthase subunit I [Bacillus infantis]MCP1160793.1 ATP synthase subunit I [Bacillus infantis]MDT0161511.1 ATP synthase subunit I [Bacillus sp. AG4(2022)]MDW2876351.1 ATP synthase subunit I [Bacillus infantis]